MRYVTSFERIAVQEAESTVLIRLLEWKFKILPEHYKQKIKQASPDDLMKWERKFVDSDELEEIFA